MAQVNRGVNKLPERHLPNGAPKLAGVQFLGVRGQRFHCANGAHEVGFFGVGVEGLGGGGEFRYVVEWQVRHRQQCPVGDAVAVTISGQRGAFHVDGHSGGAAEDAPQIMGCVPFPVAIVGGEDGTSTHEVLGFAIDCVNAGFEGALYFGNCRDGDVDPDAVVENVVAALVGVAKDEVTDAHAPIKPGTVSDHHPAFGAEDGKAVSDGFGVGWADTNVDDRDAVSVGCTEVVARHLVAAI